MKTLFTCVAIAAALLMTAENAAVAQTHNSLNMNQMYPGMVSGQKRISPGRRYGQGQVNDQKAIAGFDNSRMSKVAVQRMLQEGGYSDFQGVSRHGGTFTIAKVKRYGRELENVRIDARTGKVENPTQLNEKQAMSLLKDKGFSSIENVKTRGATITAEAKENGRQQHVSVNRETGGLMHPQQHPRP